ncbi:Endonuclease/Exonuclease/phosphatase family protein [Oceanobacillus limi]|uniref:Endonuclease/Exonuclease/phosphatase family protein n=1 Tax=Oceanobacillus limi TaxID=930131 RepID=A0A1I0FB61_9BACI|nr:Endonuclease/Exonuclease/phosphatase family protein [Oceanobacillus limi]
MIGIVEARSMLEATIQIEQKRILLFVTHLSLNPFLHHKQMKKILNEISKSPIPKLVMGDWNMKPHSKGWNEITNNLHDAWEIAGKGDGNTYPSIRPKRRLDYIFTSSSISVFAAEIIHIEPGASDHLPLRIVFSV